MQQVPLTQIHFNLLFIVAVNSLNNIFLREGFYVPFVEIPKFEDAFRVALIPHGLHETAIQRGIHSRARILPRIVHNRF